MRVFLITLSLVMMLAACKKDDSQNTDCNGCDLIGTYNGVFHQTAGCYGCMPYLDSVFSGSFIVDTITADSIVFKRSYDNYERIFAYNDTGFYSRWGCCTVSESFTFAQPDSLKYFYNNGGSGGYFREEFYGKR